jgi:argininosuccinate lyase
MIKYRRTRTDTSHRGRSRNDQVATDLRLWLREELRDVEKHLINLLKTIAERAEQDIDNIMPGYTHLQRAQVIPSSIDNRWFAY